MRYRIMQRSAVWPMLFVTLAVASPPALATSTIVTFRSTDNRYEVELYVGGRSEENGGIAGAMVGWPGHERRGLPVDAAKYHMDKEHTRAGARFVNPGDAKLPPSFTLEIQGKNGRMTIGKRVILGNASWLVGPYSLP